MTYRLAMALALGRDAETPATGLLERDGHLQELARHLAAAAAGAGRLVLLRGEAGIGKTALVERFVQELPRGTSLLSGGFDGVTTPRPFGPIRDMADQLGPDLAAMLERDTELHVVSERLVRRLAAIEPLVLVIEDLQWADEATSETLMYLARRLPDSRQLVIVTYRDDDEPNAMVRRLLGQLGMMHGVTNLRLAPLSGQAVAAMAAGTGADPAELHQLTGGNPFYLAQVLAAGAGQIPLSITDAVRARLDRLGPRPRAAMEAAAIIGSRIEAWLLAAVAGEDVLGADSCIAAGLLSRGDGDVLAFRHELTRLAVLGTVPVFKGIGLHRRALDVLLRNGSRDDARLAYHAEGAADAASVLRHAVAAGRAAMRVGANHEAVAQFERAARFIEHADDAVRADVLESMADAQYQTNRIPEAYAARHAATALRRGLEDMRAVGDGLRHVSRLAWTRGFGEEAWAAAREAIRVLEPLGESRELAMAYANLGALGMIVHEHDVGRDNSERALAMGRQLNEPEPIAYALNNLGSMAFTEGRRGGEELLLDSLRIAREHALFESAHRALFNLFVNLTIVREPRRALTYLLDLLDYTSGVQVERCNLDCALSEARLELGEWEEAERLARIALAYARSQSDDQSSGMTTLAMLAIRRGDEGAEALLAEADRGVAGFGSIGHEAPIIVARAEAAWLAGALHEMVGPLSEAYAWAVAASDPWDTGWIGRWLWLAGGIDALPEWAAEPYRLAVGGRNAEAATAFDARSLPYEAALALAVSDDPADLRDAHDRLVALGATAVARKVAGTLRETGAPVPRGPRSETRSNPAGLTQRQLEIARLVERGLTNREIADQLVLTDKTVAHHVSAVLGKLGARRRGEIGPALASLVPATVGSPPV